MMANPNGDWRTPSGSTVLTEARVDDLRKTLSAAFAGLGTRYQEASRVGADDNLRIAVNEEIRCVSRIHSFAVSEINSAIIPSLNVEFAAKSIMGDLKGFADILDNKFVELARTNHAGGGLPPTDAPSPIRGGSEA